MGCCLTKQDDNNIKCDTCSKKIKDDVKFYAYMETIYFFCSKECYNKHHYKIINIKNYGMINLDIM